MSVTTRSARQNPIAIDVLAIGKSQCINGVRVASVRCKAADRIVS
jgi:hypothetical protein